MQIQFDMFDRLFVLSNLSTHASKNSVILNAFNCKTGESRICNVKQCQTRQIYCDLYKFYNHLECTLANFWRFCAFLIFPDTSYLPFIIFGAFYSVFTHLNTANPKIYILLLHFQMHNNPKVYILPCFYSSKNTSLNYSLFPGTGPKRRTISCSTISQAGLDSLDRRQRSSHRRLQSAM
jgi:hypothetical protein